MARARNIKPSFFTNDVLAECDPLARLLFAGLWTIADREGRVEDRPKKIKAELLPYDLCDPEELLKQLCNRGFIVRYENTGNKYIQILNFVKHQNPHVKECASMIPAPNEHCTSTVQNVPLPPSPIPYTLSLLPLTDSPKREARKKTTEIVYTEDFEKAWKEYPKNSGSKQEAFKEFSKISEELSIILQGILNYVEYVNKSGEIVAHMRTWLHQRRWEIDYKGIPQKGALSGKRLSYQEQKELKHQQAIIDGEKLYEQHLLAEQQRIEQSKALPEDKRKSDRTANPSLVNDIPA